MKPTKEHEHEARWAYLCAPWQPRLLEAMTTFAAAARDARLEVAVADSRGPIRKPFYEDGTLHEELESDVIVPRPELRYDGPTEW